MLANIKKELQKVETDKLKSLLKDFDLSIKSGEIPEEAKFKVLISSEAVDRDGDIVKQDGLDLTWYNKNPIVLANHWYTVENIIGKTTRIWKEDGKTYAEGFFSQTNPKAKLFQDLYNEGLLKVVSIGFIVKERDVNNRKVITKSELLEYSFVAVQSNRDAMSLDGKALELYNKAVDEGIIIEEKDLEEPKKIEDKEEIKMIEKIQKEFSELKTELKEIKDIVKSLANDKAEEKKQKELDEQVKLKAQNLAKGLSAFLGEIKKNSKK